MSVAQQPDELSLEPHRDRWCTCASCRAKRPSKGKTTSTFETVATVIGIYKVARHYWDQVKESPHPFADADKLAKARELQNAEFMLEALVNEFNQLSAASRKLLSIFLDELHKQELTNGLEALTVATQPQRWVDYGEEGEQPQPLEHNGLEGSNTNGVDGSGVVQERQQVF